MTVTKKVTGKTRYWLVRLVILLGLMMVVIFSRGEQSLSAHSVELTSDSAELPASSMFEGTCEMPEAGFPDTAALPSSDDSNRKLSGGDIAPIRYVMDPFPTFNGIAVDGENGKVLVSDTNRKGLLLYDRTSGSRSPEETSPLRQVTGPSTLLGYIAGVAIDPERREVYGVNNDIEDNVAVFSYDDDGDLKPRRVLAVPHQAWGIALSRSRDEMAVTVEGPNAVVVYRRGAKGMDAPVRNIRGANTGMADPHGVSWDETHKELIVANHGNKSGARPNGPSLGGQFSPPSITVYPEAAAGDVRAVRTIQGARTQLAWPMGLDVDPERNEIAVANNGDNSVLIFSRTANGDVAPARVISGSLTGIDRPMGVAFDRKNDELWVANYGNHSAVVFGRAAKGNLRPKRIIRSAPAGTPTGGFGNPMTIAFDGKRGELLVPN